MSRLTYPQRIGLLLTGILALLAVLAIALMPAPKADIPTYTAPQPQSADSAASSKPKAKPASAPAAPPRQRNHLNEEF